MANRKQGANAHVYTIRNTAGHNNFSLTEQRENKLHRKLHGDIKMSSKVQYPENKNFM